MCLTFHKYPLRRDINEKFEKIFGGYPHLGPLKAVAHKNEHPRTLYNNNNNNNNNLFHIIQKLSECRS